MIALFHGNNFLKIQLHPFFLWGEDKENHRMESLWPWSLGDLWFWQCALVKMRIQQNDPLGFSKRQTKSTVDLQDYLTLTRWNGFLCFFQDVTLNYSSYSVLAFSHLKRVGPPHLTLWHVRHVPEVTLLGDAAHPLLPYGSQGATQAGWNSEVKGFPMVDGSEIPKTDLGCIKNL